MNRTSLILACLLLGWNAHRAYVRHLVAREIDPIETNPDIPEVAPWYVERVVRDMAYRSRWDC